MSAFLTVLIFTLPLLSPREGEFASNITVFDSKGNTAKLYELFEGKPVILSPIYTRCPHACSLITSKLEKILSRLGTKGFKVITFSFDPSDTPEDLARFERRWKRSENWIFVSSDKEGIQKLLDSIGFAVEWDEESGQYIHPNVVVILTPSGKISSYISVFSASPEDFRKALERAGEEGLGKSIFAKILSVCLRYNPETGKTELDPSFITHAVSGIFALLLLLTIAKSFSR